QTTHTPRSRCMRPWGCRDSGRQAHTPRRQYPPHSFIWRRLGIRTDPTVARAGWEVPHPRNPCYPCSPMSDVLDLFRQTGALLHGHFILRSGLHSREFFQCAILLQHATIASHVCSLLAEKLREFGPATIVSPAVGGIVVGQEVARHLDTRHIFVEKDGQG